ncbi:MAG: DUF4126 domain-containing protein [Deltaproteobacteria bacterium]
MEALLSVCIGVGLSAACGFRVFMPLMIMSVASLTGDLKLAEGFEWIGTYPALGAFTVASFIEICAYYIPWLDNLLDTIAVPAGTIAGTIAMASSITEMSPMLRWAVAVIVGGGVAGTIQGFTALTRIASTAGTGGLANPLVSTLESGGAVGMSVLAVMLPVGAAVVVIAVLYFALKKILSWLFRKREVKIPPQESETTSPFLN